ncbi:AAA family ATPase [Candidatus Binatia bacterium]|nr:AAA family ATPase [Candidatus Binatia bacterium]
MPQRTPSNLVGWRAEPLTASSSADPRAERAFVGRREELARLRGGIEVAARGRGSCALITGEAGVGKTRLVSEFAAEASHAGITVAWGRCWEAGGAPSYWPWVEVIRKLVAAGELHDLGSHGLFLAQLVPDLAEPLGVAGQPAPTPSDPDSARFLMFDAIGALLRRSVRRAPLLVVLDDLHRADHASLLLLAFLARRLTDVPLLIVGTLRNDEGDVSPAAVEPLADAARNATRIELQGLHASDIERLLEATPAVPSRAALAARMHDATAGNPFFVDEILRSLAGRAAGWERSGTVELRTPSGVRDAIRLKLASMSPASVHALEVAAVIGREFDTSLVGRAQRQSASDVLAALVHPAELGIVAEVPGRPGRFQFRHALIRDALYEALPSARRIALHQQVGEAFESVADAAPDRHLGELAHHFLVAAAHGDDRFVKHAMHAARRALARMAFEEAVTLYQRTLDALVHVDPDERQRCEILLALAEAEEWANDAAGSRDSFEQAADIARRLDATDLFVRAALGVGAVAARKFTATSRYESAPLLIREALRRLVDHAPGTEALLLSRLALHDLSSGARSEALRTSAEAVALARTSADLATLSEVLIVRNGVLFGPDHIAERLAIADEVIALGNQLLRNDLVMRGHALRFTVRFESCDIRGADHDLEQHQILAERSSDPFDCWANLVWRGARVLLEGRFSEAQQLAERAMSLVVNVPGLHGAEVNGPAAFAGQILLIADTATRELPCQAVATDYTDKFPEASAWRVVELLLQLRAKDLTALPITIDRLAANDFQDFERNGQWLCSMSLLAEAVAFIGDRTRASMLYSLLLPYEGLQGTASIVASFGPVSRYLGLLAATLDQWETAEEYFASAISSSCSMGASPHLAKTYFDDGRLLAARGDAAAIARGIDLLETARQLRRPRHRLQGAARVRGAARRARGRAVARRGVRRPRARSRAA